jgi:DNA-binding transcriptional LysR family regulator
MSRVASGLEGDVPFTNIPTDLLRTLVSVVDLRSFTKAAHQLGITQPAVSAQIKRLQSMLNADIFDRSAPGVSLTRAGEAVVDHARRLLSINDVILTMAEPKEEARRISIGLPGDLSGPLLPWTLAKFRMRWPQLNYKTFSGGASALLREMRQGNVDIVVGLSREAPADARHTWSDQLVWVRSDATRIDPNGAVPMLAFSEECMCYRSGVHALREAGRTDRLVMTRGRVRMTQLKRWDDAPLPKLPELHAGIYVRDGSAAEIAPLNDLADELSPLLRPKPEAQSDRNEFRAVRSAFSKAEYPGL